MPTIQTRLQMQIQIHMQIQIQIQIQILIQIHDLTPISTIGPLQIHNLHFKTLRVVGGSYQLCQQDIEVLARLL